MTSRSEESEAVQALTRAARNQDWEYVDRHVPAIAQYQAAMNWVDTFGLESPHQNLRDLAATICQHRKGELSFGIREKLVAVMNGRGVYDRFRAACALSVHGWMDDDVIGTLSEFSKDQDEEVAKLARKYLKKRHE